jgi:Leucine-rich repeat (LRR) protein
LVNLELLDLRQNQLAIELIPPELGRLTRLERLLMSKNNLSTLPAEIKTMYGLKELDVANNVLLSVPEEIGCLVRPPRSRARLCALSQAYLNFPAQLQSNLQKLNVSGNRLLTLPPTVALLTALTKLDIKGNEIHELPSEIGELVSVVKIDMSHNMLTKYAVRCLRSLNPRLC